MSSRRVVLIADRIQVTASSEERALAYIREDAAQFRRDWNYRDGEVEETDEEVAEDASDASLDVEVEHSAGRGDRTWTGSASFGVVVDAEDDASAYAAARRLLAA